MNIACNGAKFQVENKIRDLNENLNNSLPFADQALVSIYDSYDSFDYFDYFDETDHDKGDETFFPHQFHFMKFYHDIWANFPNFSPKFPPILYDPPPPPPPPISRNKLDMPTSSTLVNRPRTANIVYSDDFLFRDLHVFFTSTNFRDLLTLKPQSFLSKK